jgi:hypothetical protein
VIYFKILILTNLKKKNKMKRILQLCLVLLLSSAANAQLVEETYSKSDKLLGTKKNNNTLALRVNDHGTKTEFDDTLLEIITDAKGVIKYVTEYAVIHVTVDVNVTYYDVYHEKLGESTFIIWTTGSPMVIQLFNDGSYFLYYGNLNY